MTAITLSGNFENNYRSKSNAYFAGARDDFVAHLPVNPDARILEIGCGSGETGALALKAGRAGHYAGVELMLAPAQKAARQLSEVVIGNVEKLELTWQPASFDALILSEVLEHLVDPNATLKRLAPLMRPGAIVLASSPNISHWRVLREILFGRFPQHNQGVFDRTHLRWFTPKTFQAMFEDAGFEVKSVAPVTPFATRTQILSRLSGGRLDHFFMTQIALVAHRR